VKEDEQSWAYNRLQILTARHTMLHASAWDREYRKRYRQMQRTQAGIVIVRPRRRKKKSVWLSGGAVLLATMAIWAIGAVSF